MKVKNRIYDSYWKDFKTRYMFLLRIDKDIDNRIQHQQ